jgi:LSD1 subclass zinc finger protein
MTKPSKYFPPQTPEAKPVGALRIKCPVCHALPGVYCTKMVDYKMVTQTIAHKRRREEEERTR